MLTTDIKCAFAGEGRSEPPKQPAMCGVGQLAGSPERYRGDQLSHPENCRKAAIALPLMKNFAYDDYL